MSNQPLVSVCVLTYNHKDYIKQCLEGILAQKTSFKFEIILGEDESLDGTREICIDYANRYPELIKLFLRSRKDVIFIGGKPTGRYNFIENLKASKGKYIALCEGDDFWTDPLKLQKQVDFLEKNSKYVLSFHKVKLLMPNGDLVEDNITEVPLDYGKINTLLEKGNYIHTPSVVFKNVIDCIPFEFLEVPFGDYFLYTMLAEKGIFIYLKDEMAIYRAGVGVISKMNDKDRLLNYIKQFSCMISYLNKENLKKILIERQVAMSNSYYYLIEDKYYEIKAQYKHSFVSRNPIFMQLKKIQNYYWKFKNK